MGFSKDDWTGSEGGKQIFPGLPSTNGNTKCSPSREKGTGLYGQMVSLGNTALAGVQL